MFPNPLPRPSFSLSSIVRNNSVVYYSSNNIIRESYYLKRIISTKAYNIGYFLTLPKKKISKLFKNDKKRKYEKFLNNFYKKRKI